MATKPKTTVIPKITGGGSKYDSLNAGIDKLNKSLAGGVTGVQNADGSTIKGKVYFTPTGAVDKKGKSVGGGSTKVTNTTGVTANPKNTEATDAGVVSSEQGVTQLKQYQSDAQKLDVGLGTKESPLTDSQINDLEKQGIVEGDTVPGKGRLHPGGYWVNDIPPPKDTAPAPTATYIDPNTGATTTTTGASAGSEEEKKKMAEKGMSLSESTTTAEDMTDPEIKKAEDEYAALTKEINTYKNKLLDLIISDSDLKSDIRGISSAYDARIAEMRNITDRQIQSVKTLGYRMGMQFTGGMGGVFGGIISNAEQEGLLKIADIEGMKQSKILEAKAAARENNYKIYASLMEDARSLSTQKASALADLKKAQKEQDAAIAKRKSQVTRDAAIADLYHNQGITDAAQIVDFMNYDDQGNFIGDTTLEDVEKALKILNPPDKFKGMDSSVATWDYMKKIGEIPEDMSHAEYVRMMKNITNPKETTITKDEAIFQMSQFFTPDAVLPDGSPVMGQGYKTKTVLNTDLTDYGGPIFEEYNEPDPSNVYVGADGWKYLIEQVAPSMKLSRQDFIKNYTTHINPDHLNPKDLIKYGFNPDEANWISGAGSKGWTPEGGYSYSSD